MSRVTGYEIDKAFKKISEGQKCTKDMFDLLAKLGFAVKWDNEEAVRLEIALYLHRLVYGNGKS